MENVKSLHSGAALKYDAELERSDEQLLSWFLEGDSAAFQKLVARYEKELLHFLMRFLGNRADAEDMRQETFLVLFKKAAQFDTTQKFKTWFFTIATNKARDLLRTRGRHSAVESFDNPIVPTQDAQFMQMMEGPAADPSATLVLQDIVDDVRGAVAQLPDKKQAKLLSMTYFDGMSLAQIAEILRIPIGTVKSGRHAARQSFAELFSQKFDPREYMVA